MGCFTYLILGSTPMATVAPVAISTYMTGIYAKGNPDLSVLLSFVVGVVGIFVGFFNLGENC